MDRYATDPGSSLADLRDAVAAAVDIDDAIAPVAWGECKDYSRTDDAALIVDGSAAAAGASAASCAGAGAAGGTGGGAC